ncbi:MAG: (2Fe-2S) ferredoxin domain-containing protein [Clostridia bacterium]|jgi:NADP-reducing hydrogenase subunit HndB|nr:(2Fe-2S) ferredoxin domain-containing protein [Clostridia bacterium]
MKSIEELLAIKEKAQAQIAARDADGNDGIRVVVGMATCGIAAGARPVLKALTEELEKRNVKNVSVTQTGCIGMCQYEPIIEVYAPGKEKVTYVQMTAEKAVKVVTDHLVNGEVVADYTVGAVTE